MFHLVDLWKNQSYHFCELCRNYKCSIWSICEKFKILYSPIYLQKSAPIQPKFLVTGGYEAVASPRQLELSTRNLPENKTHWDPEVAGCFLCSYQNPSQLSQRSLMQRLDISPTKCVVVTEEKGTWKKRYNWISSFLRFSRILNWSIRASVPRLYILLVCSRCSFVFGCSFQHPSPRGRIGRLLPFGGGYPATGFPRSSVDSRPRRFVARTFLFYRNKFIYHQQLTFRLSGNQQQNQKHRIELFFCHRV